MEREGASLFFSFCLCVNWSRAHGTSHHNTTRSLERERDFGWDGKIYIVKKQSGANLDLQSGAHSKAEREHTVF